MNPSLPLKTQYSKFPVLEPTQESCPVGFRYRKPFFVSGSCVNNPKNSLVASDDRCPTGMHWRKTFEVKPSCVRLPTQQRLKKKKQDIQNPSLLLPTCSAELVTPLFKDHIKLILSNLEEHFTVPISTNQLETKSRVFSKIKRQFVKSIQKKLEDKRCEFRPSGIQMSQIENIIKSVVYVFNSRFLTPEKWDIVARAAELDLLLLASRELVSPKYYGSGNALTIFYVEQIRELRRLLQYMDSENLLPRQNLAVALAYYNYLDHFFTVMPNLHNVPVTQPPVPYDQRVQNMSRAQNKAIVEGYVQVKYKPSQKNAPLQLMTPEEAAVLQTSIPLLKPVNLTDEITLLEAAPIVEALPEMGGNIPALPNATVVALPIIVRDTSTPAQMITEKMMNDLYEMYIIFETYNAKTNAKLNIRGQELFAVYEYLFNELARYQNYQKNENELLTYIKNYGESQLDPHKSITISSLNTKYFGPFWTEQNVTIHCPYCNQLLSISDYMPNQVFICPFCGNNIKLK